MEKAVAFLSVFGLGMSFSVLGSISIKLMPRLKMDQAKFGSLVSAFMFCCLVASLIVGVTIDSLGYKPVAIAGFIITGICFLLLARSKSYGAMVLACLLLGFGAMALNTAGNTMGPVVLYGGQEPARASNLLNVFFGLGLFLTPLIVSFLFQKTSYENAISVLAIIVLAPAILAILATYPKSEAGFQFGDAVALLKEPAVLVAAFVLFCYIALESSFCNWLPPYGKEVITSAKPDMAPDAADASAQRMLSAFAIAMMAGRLISSQVPGLTDMGTYVIAGCALVSAVVIFIMMATKSARAAWILAALAGLAFAPCFPTTVGVTFGKFTPAVYGSVFGIIFAVGLAGAVIIPKAIGNLAKGSSVQKSLKLLLPACVLLIILSLVLGVVKGPGSAAATQPTTPVPVTQPATTPTTMP
jgi:fucose permease